MTERPILFSGPMVRAILEDRKTQTRRVVRPALWPAVEESARINGKPAIYMLDYDLPCPYGEIGDTLWVREGFAYAAASLPAERMVYYREDKSTNGWTPARAHLLELVVWRPSIHMPRWASRITLRITDLQIQRVQELTEADARAEGMTIGLAKWEFHEVWDSINCGRGHGWDANPWVWVIAFVRMEPRA